VEELAVLLSHLRGSAYKTLQRNKDWQLVLLIGVNKRYRKYPEKQGLRVNSRQSYGHKGYYPHLPGFLR
jgi:hypothetical protein